MIFVKIKKWWYSPPQKENRNNNKITLMLACTFRSHLMFTNRYILLAIEEILIMFMGSCAVCR